jgi:DNA-binding transcriptional LysR family regulator
MNIRQLRCFETLMVLGTATDAAAALGISQPAVSVAIASLEKELGFALFERVKGRLRPTREAQFLLDDAKSAVGAIDRAVQTARAVRNHTHGNLVIASYPGIALEFLPRVIAKFLKPRPGVRVELLSRSSHVLHELIPAQSFDVAIADLPVNRQDVLTRALSLECVCVLPKRHPLGRKRLITPPDLHGMPFFSLFKEHLIYLRVANAFAAANTHWNVVAECRFFASACAFVSQSWGACIVDPITANDFARRGLLVRPFRPSIMYDIGILLPVRRPQSRLTRDFVVEVERELQVFGASAGSARMRAADVQRRKL